VLKHVLLGMGRKSFAELVDVHRLGV